MAFGIVAVLLALAAHTAGARLSSTAADGRGASARPSPWMGRWQTGGWLLSLVGAALITEQLWNSHPGVSITVFVGVIVVVNALPSLVVTLLRTRKVTT